MITAKLNGQEFRTPEIIANVQMSWTKKSAHEHLNLQIANVELARVAQSRAISVQSGSMSGVAAARAETAQHMGYRGLSGDMSTLAAFGSGAVSGQEYEAALGRAQQTLQQMQSLKQAELEAVRQEFDLRARMNQESIAAAQARLGIVQQEKSLFQSDEDRLTAAKGRFNRMTSEERGAFAEARSVAQSGGMLTTKQIDLLRSMGTATESQLADEAEQRLAQKNGFSYGGFERGRQARTVQRASRLGELQSEADRIDAALQQNPQGPNRKSLEGRRAQIQREQEALQQQQRQDASRRGPRDTKAEQIFGGIENQIAMSVQAKVDLSHKIQINSDAMVKQVTQELMRVMQQSTEILRKVAAQEADNKIRELQQQGIKNRQAP